MAPAIIQEIEDDDVAPTTIELEPVESTLCKLLLDVAKHIDDSPPGQDGDSQVPLPEPLANTNLVLRFTGGWVRDKLLGTPSHDIDVAINKMTGYQFGLRMKEYLEMPGSLEKYGLEAIASNEKQNQKAGTTDKSKTVGGLHKIEANPEKSKHLETTTVRILGLDVDLVNLRKETYSDDSRNPQMEFGTPEEDALRRDATVNAMFYNVNTQEVEDFTGYGHQDMKDQLLRTPLEPYQTFKDDPLRVLRLIRFASRLSYTIEPEVLVAMRHADIKDALRRKISRERVGTELEKVLHGPDPYEALRLVSDLELYETIFSDPSEGSAAHYKPDTKDWRRVIDTLNKISSSHGKISEGLMRDKEEQYLAWQLAALVPFRDAPQLEAAIPGRRPPPPTAVTIAKEGIKAPNKICDVIDAAVRHQTDISNLVDGLWKKMRRPEKKFKFHDQDPTARDVLGMAIRRWGSSWRSQVAYSMLVDVANEAEQTDGDAQQEPLRMKRFTDMNPAIERKYTSFLDHIYELDITETHNLKPLLDGKALAKALQTKPGPWMKDALDVVVAWQLRNPGVDDPQAAIEEVQNHQRNGELSSDLTRHFLTLTIRPLFAKTSPASVTDKGRKAVTPSLPKKLTAESMDDSVNKPWKSEKDAFALDLLRWAVRSVDAKLLETVWPSIVPPILTLIDDWEVKYRCVGVHLLNSLLQATPTALLKKTGLSDVFEDALMPCLSYLPTLTEVDESVSLLNATYACLITLANVRFPPLHAHSLGASSLDLHKVKFLDAVLRKGIIYGYSHCSNYPKIITVLFDSLVPILDGLGLDAVKAIKYILPMLTESLARPFGAQTLPMCKSAASALQTLIRRCWPRMTEYRGEVLKGVTMCWIKVVVPLEEAQEAGGSGAAILRDMLQDVVKMLSVAVGGQCGFDAECEFLVAANERLKGLFEKA